MSMTQAYAEAYALAVTTAEPAVIVETRDGDFRAMLADDYRRAPHAGAYFDSVTPEEE